MLTASYLLQGGDARRKVAVTALWLEERKSKVQLAITNCSDDPLDVVVPEGFVEVVEDFNWEDLR